MNSIYKICILFVIIFSVASSCEEKVENSLTKDMVELDKSFVPVMYFVLQGDLREAKKSSFFLKHTWGKMERKYKVLHPENDDWQESIRMTTAWLADAITAIDSNVQQDAFIFLDHVRYQLIELRRQQDIDYYLDYVWEFEASLDVVEEVAVDQMLCLLEYCEFEELVEDVNFAFQELKKAELDATLFEFEKIDLAEIRLREKRIAIALDNFNRAVAEADGEEVAVTVTLLDQAYIDYLHSFGDFVNSQSYFAGL